VSDAARPIRLAATRLDWSRPRERRQGPTGPNIRGGRRPAIRPSPGGCAATLPPPGADGRIHRFLDIASPAAIIRSSSKCGRGGAAINQVFKALADPTRREILRLLGQGEKTAGDLADRFDLTKPSVSHHFAVLKEAGLIRSRRSGQQIYYSLDTTVVQDVLARVWDLFPGLAPGDGRADGGEAGR